MSRVSTDNKRTTLFVALCVAVLVAGAIPAVAATAPVTATFAVTGSPAPGASVTVKATVTVNDGSTISGYKWTQTGGVDATLTNTTTDTVSVALGARKAYKDELITILGEAPIADATLPPPDPSDAEFTGGIQNRWTVVGIAPLSLEEAGAVKLDLAVTTSSGTYHVTTSVATALPWPTATGNTNVPKGLPVILHGKTQAAYNWSMIGPTGSTATLSDATSQNPDFTPDVVGKYEIRVSDLATGNAVFMTVYAGTWKGIITGQDANGRPTWDAACKECHKPNTPNFDLFTPWSKSGHAEIFTQNVNTPNGHYSASCLSCHTVGYMPGVTNGGVDDASDWTAFLASNLLTHGDPGNWTKILAQFPATARLSNIQCENCHGPQDSAAHTAKDGSRQTLSSDLCGTCHGEPARHGRYQQWQLSGHADYSVAQAEGTNPGCAKCHSAQGFVQWGDKGFASNATIDVTWTADTVHPQTCATCHDPHAVGTTSGDANTNATVRITGDTPMLDAGFVAKNIGRGAICVTCHNSRRGLRNDQTPITDLSRATHVGPQGDIVMGQNMYFATVGTPGAHSKVEDACVTCHMEKTSPPPNLSYNLGGTNHTFFASKTICSKCHTSFTADGIQGPVETKMASLKSEIEKALMGTMQAQIRLGNQVTIGTAATLKNVTDVKAVELTEASGRQAAIVTLSTGAKTPATALNNVKIVRPGGSSSEILAVADVSVAKAGWNYFMVESDASEGVHNPSFVNAALDVTLFAVRDYNAGVSAPGGNAGVGGGSGNGAGAVTCTTPYVYWTELAAHAAGAGTSQWRTDVVARNLSSGNASLKFVLHQSTGDLSGTGAVAGSSQKTFEDIVATLGGTDTKGSLEICSDQPLLVAGRNYNQDTTGTFGQNFDGYVADLGYGAGQTVSLIGLRQKTDAYRSNISVTNGGKTEAQVSITLFAASGTSLKTYTLTVPAGQVVQDIEPFKARANQPDVDWGYATVTVVKGTNIRTSGSMVDMKTNDGTTIIAKQ